MAIHPTAIISREAIIDETTEIGPYTIIEGCAKIGKNNRIMAHAFIGTNTTIGDNNQIHMGAVLGNIPQDISYNGDPVYLTIGNNNVIREYATIHRGSKKDHHTIIGDNCFLMGSTHVAHDCKLGNNVIMANFSGIAGHSEIADRVFIAGGAVVHQFVRIGRFAMLSGNARLSMDVPPFVIAGERNQCWGINVVGLRRAGFPRQNITELRKLYRLFFCSSLTRPKILEQIRSHPSLTPEAQEFISFLENSKRGVCRFFSEKMSR